MKNNIEPQIIFVFNSSKKIQNTYFLSFLEEISETKQFQLFNYFLTNNKEIFTNTEYTVLKEHVLLTLTLSETRGYLRHILNIEERILLFSLNNNLDYKEKGDEVFNPFNISNVCEKNPEDSVLYEIYESIASDPIFCIISEKNYNKKEICSYGKYNKNISVFIKNIFSNMNEDISVRYNEKEHILFNLCINESFFYYIKNSFINKTINLFDSEKIYISGDRLTLLNLQETDFLKIQIYKDNEEKIDIMINDGFMDVYNLKVLEEILLHQQQINHFLVVEKMLKKKIVVEFFGVILESSMNIDYDLDFFIKNTKKTKNIFMDRSKKINIILSTKHIIFSSYKIYTDLFIYLTTIILSYQILKKSVKYNIPIRKVDQLYLSRYCQSFRKPIIVKDVNWDNYIKINDVIYRSKNEKEGDIYKTNDFIYFCPNKDLKFISFINEIYKGYKICLPCCYKKRKVKTKFIKNVFKLIRITRSKNVFLIFLFITHTE